MISVINPKTGDPARSITKQLLQKGERLGFENKFSLLSFIRQNIGEKPVNVPNQAKTIVKETLKKIRIDEKPIKVFIFPTTKEFVKKEMNGYSGFSHKQDQILLFTTKNSSFIPQTLSHEYAHAIMHRYHDMSDSVDSMLVFEGIAEHFKEDQIDKNPSPWVNVVSKEEAKKTYHELDELTTYFELFHGTRNHKRWIGYTIAYYIIQDYLQQNTKRNWKTIFKTKPQNIIQKTKWKKQ